jgi:hypothetical protein
MAFRCAPQGIRAEGVTTPPHVARPRPGRLSQPRMNDAPNLAAEFAPPFAPPLVRRTVHFAHPDVSIATLLANRALNRCRIQPVSLRRIFGAGVKAVRLRRVTATLLVAATERRFTRAPLALVLSAPHWSPPGFALSTVAPPATPNVFCEEGESWWASGLESVVAPIQGVLMVGDRPISVAEWPEPLEEELAWAHAVAGGTGPDAAPPVARPWPNYWAFAMHRLWPAVCRNRNVTLANSPALNDAALLKLKGACVDEHIGRAPCYLGLDASLEVRLEWPKSEWDEMEFRARRTPSILCPAATVAIRFEGYPIH